MDKDDGSEVLDSVRPVFLGDQSDKGIINYRKATAVQAGHGVEGCHNVHFNNPPTGREEASRETIRTREFVHRHAPESCPHLFLGENTINMLEFKGWESEIFQVKGETYVHRRSNQFVKEGVYGLGLIHMINNSHVVHEQVSNEVLPPSMARM
jgi:hypothetical protein